MTDEEAVRALGEMITFIEDSEGGKSHILDAFDEIVRKRHSIPPGDLSQTPKK